VDEVASTDEHITSVVGEKTFVRLPSGFMEKNTELGTILEGNKNKKVIFAL
jgi:hypothetical protein